MCQPLGKCKLDRGLTVRNRHPNFHDQRGLAGSGDDRKGHDGPSDERGLGFKALIGRGLAVAVELTRGRTFDPGAGRERIPTAFDFLFTRARGRRADSAVGRVGCWTATRCLGRSVCWGWVASRLRDPKFVRNLVRGPGRAQSAPSRRGFWSVRTFAYAVDSDYISLG